MSRMRIKEKLKGKRNKFKDKEPKTTSYIPLERAAYAKCIQGPLLILRFKSTIYTMIIIIVYINDLKHRIKFNQKTKRSKKEIYLEKTPKKHNENTSKTQWILSFS
jgi:hypothetical protein